MTVRRKYLTPRQRVAMLARQGYRCAKCGAGIDGTGRTCIAEHWTPVALGNAAKPDCLLCLSCAARKTNGSPATSYGSDKHAIAKDKRLRGITKKETKHPFRKPPEGHRYNWPSRKVGA